MKLYTKADYILEKGPGDGELVAKAALDPEASPASLKKFMSTAKCFWTSSWAAVKNPSCPIEVLNDILSEGRDDELSYYAMTNPNTSIRVAKEWMREVGMPEDRVEVHLASKSPLQDALNALRGRFVFRAQQILDAWQPNDDGIDEEYGHGGCCDDIAAVIGEVIHENIPDVELLDYGHEGDDHSAVIVRNGEEAFLVDIPSSVYEYGGGYNWVKKENVQLEPYDVSIQGMAVPKTASAQIKVAYYPDDLSGKLPAGKGIPAFLWEREPSESLKPQPRHPWLDHRNTIERDTPTGRKPYRVSIGNSHQRIDWLTEKEAEKMRENHSDWEVVPIESEAYNQVIEFNSEPSWYRAAKIQEDI
jgi:hypothetical protein